MAGADAAAAVTGTSTPDVDALRQQRSGDGEIDPSGAANDDRARTVAPHDAGIN
jgi:hypothetical protein